MREFLLRSGLGAWAGLSVVLVGYTLGAHLTSLPAPAATDPALVRGLGELFPPPGPPGAAASAAGTALLAVHVLYDRCGCSARVGKSLTSRGPRPSIREVVLLVSDDVASTDHEAVDNLRRAGYPVAALSTREVAERLHVLAVPLLVVVDGAGTLRYAGGYTAGRDRPELEDGRVLAELEAGHHPAALPIFGCATATDLQKKLDPFGIKY